MKKCLLFFLSVIVLHVYAQNTSNKKAQNNFDLAQELVRKQSYPEGIKALQEVVRADPNFLDAYILLAEVYRKLQSYPEARQNYLKALSLSKTISSRIYFGLGEAEIFTGDYQNAQQHFQSYLQSAGNTDPDGAARAKKYILDCNFAIEALKSPVKYNPVNLGKAINTQDKEYFPSLTADGETLIFTRQINGNEDFYIAKKKDGIWQQASPLSSNINTQQFNEGAQSISPDGNYLFFTGCNRPGGLGRCDIYVSHKEGNNWAEPYNLGSPVNTEYWESQPAISPDGNTLYFVSNRPGGYGGYDIWKSTITNDGHWGQPENLGPDINTPYDENTPFMHADGQTLYFSSDGWPGFGKKDIFLSRPDKNNKWQKPINLGYPINTFNDETGLMVSADGNTGMFSSNSKDGFGAQDIYSFNLSENIRPLPVTYVKGLVKDRETGKILESYIQIADLKGKKTVFEDNTNAETGSFLAVMPIGSSYSFNASSEGYLFYSENYELSTSQINKPFEIEILLDKIKTGANVTLKNVFFETNKFELLPQSITELDKLLDFLTENPEVCIEIQGHTDNVGDRKTNETLSLNRAKSVYSYLIQKNTDAKRLSFKSYGENQPLADNNTEAGRKQNRRTSFIITKI